MQPAKSKASRLANPVAPSKDAPMPARTHQSQCRGNRFWSLMLLPILLSVGMTAMAADGNGSSKQPGGAPIICASCDPGGGGGGTPALGSSFVGQTIPTTMIAGQTYSVTVQMANAGTTTWTAGSTYTLGSQNAVDNLTWGLKRVSLGASTAYGATATFSFNVQAPATAGTYNFQWRMVKGTTWFGALSTNVAVVVSAASPNTPPVVQLTAPVNGATAQAPASITLAATASDAGGSVASVEFWSNGAKLGTDPSAPYSWPLTNLAAGSYQFKAVATDNQGASTTSATATFVVSAASTVIGAIDGIVTDPVQPYQITGWACSTGLVQSIDVNLYLGGPNGSGTFITGYPANRASEPAIATACGSTGTAYRYAFSLSTTLRKQYANQKIYVYGLSPVGGSNNLLSQSGSFLVPPLATVSVTRTYVYDASERLCKSINPESGATVQAYDIDGNVSWSADGTSLTSNVCDRDSVGESAKTIRTHDLMGRVTSITGPGAATKVTTTYESDGLVASLVSLNSDGSSVATAYNYNHRRLLVSETSSQPGWYSWTTIYGFDASGNPSSITYPSGIYVDYAPNALGEPTKVGTFATGLSYYPGGALRQFTYGNGITHVMTRNLRGLPTRSQDMAGAAVILDDTYAFDGEGNVTDITDRAQNGATTRGMAYDGLNRLSTAVALGMWGTAQYTYDGLDNLRTSTLGMSGYIYVYDAGNRLSSLVRSGGATLAYTTDARGNITNDGRQSYQFDTLNRLSSVVGKEAYRYDGMGRRVLNWRPGSPLSLYMYAQSGQVLYVEDGTRNRSTSNIYLGNTLLAERSYNNATGLVTVEYQHTDALGTPTVVTDISGAIVDRVSYSPYGIPLNHPVEGLGYSGHVMDQLTGLTYMQQRYYDPQIGRFLSVDPMVSDMDNGWNFNRYSYAANNPYKFTDPDGRLIFLAPLAWKLGVGFVAGAGTEIALQMAGGKSLSDVDISDVLVSGAIGAVLGGPVGTGAKVFATAPRVARAARAVSTLSAQARGARTARRVAKIEGRIQANAEKIMNATGDVAVTAGAAATGVAVKKGAQAAVNNATEPTKPNGSLPEPTAKEPQIRR